MDVPRHTGSRVQSYMLPNTWTQCKTQRCVYNTGGWCDMPRINKGNSDAACHRMSNVRLFAWLEPVGDIDRPCSDICAGKVRDGVECAPGVCAVRDRPKGMDHTNPGGAATGLRAAGSEGEGWGVDR